MPLSIRLVGSSGGSENLVVKRIDFRARAMRALLVAAVALFGLSGCALLPVAVAPIEVAAAGTVVGAGMVGGALYRQRGGGVPLPIGTQGARLIWSVPTGLFVAALAGELWLAPVVVATTFGGLLLGHGAHQRSAQGLVNEPAYWEQDELASGWLSHIFGPYDRDWPTWRKELWHYAGMATIQTLRIALIVAPVLAFEPTLAWAIPAGLFPAYWLGWRTPSDIPHLEQGSEMGEFLTGVAIFVALLLAGGGA